MKVRAISLYLAVAMLCTAMLISATPATAQVSSVGAYSVPITGRASNGTPFVGVLKIERFVSTSSGKVRAIGSITGTAGSRTLGTTRVSLPVSLSTTAQTAAAAAASCPILNLTIGPIHLDLLGLVIDTNTIHLSINAQ